MPPMIDNFAEPTIGDYVRSVWRSKHWIAAAAVLGAIIASIAPIDSSATYSSNVTVTIDSESLYVKALDLQITGLGAASATAEMNRALLPAIVTAVEAKLGRDVSVAAAASETIGEITFTSSADTSDHAREDAEVYVQTFIASRVADQRSSVDTIIAALQPRLTSLRDERAQLEERIGGLDPSQTQLATALGSELDALNDRMASVDDRIAALERFSADTSAGLAQSSDPTDPVASSGPGRAVRAAIGLVVGALLAAVAVLARAFSDRSLRTRADVELTAPGVVVLGVIPAGVSSADSGWTSAATDSIDRRLAHLGITGTDVALVPAGARSTVEDAVAALSGTTPTLRASDSVITGDGDLGDARRADAVLVVVRSGATTDEELSATLTRLGDAEVTVAGIVLDGVDRRSLPAAAISVGAGVGGNGPRPDLTLQAG